MAKGLSAYEYRKAVRRKCFGSEIVRSAFLWIVYMFVLPTMWVSRTKVHTYDAQVLPRVREGVSKETLRLGLLLTSCYD